MLSDYYIYVSAFIVVLTALAFILLTSFYKRAQKDTAYVRTGMGGEKVIVSSGAFVLPVLHNITPINMKTFRIEITRENEHALLTKDPLRVDVMTVFLVRVGQEPSAISVAAGALGEKTMHPESVQELVEAQCVAALRSAAAALTLNELHQKRADFERNVEEALGPEFGKNGLELVSASLTRLDQTDKIHFDPTNAFDAEGLTMLEKIKSNNDNIRNTTARDTELAIKKKDLETRIQKEKLDYEETVMQNDRKRQKAENEAETQRRIEEINFEKELLIERAQQTVNIQQAQLEREVSQAWIETNKVKAEFEKISEEIRTARERAEAERSRIVELISAEKEARRQTIIATANAEVEKLAAGAAKIRYEIEAAGKRALNEASNLLSNEQISMQVKLEIVKQLPNIIRESVRPIENIEGIKIMHIDGLNNAMGGGRGGSGNGDSGSGNSNGSGGSSLADQVVDSALRYRAQVPLIESLLGEVGLKGHSIHDLTSGLREEMRGEGKKPSADTEKKRPPTPAQEREEPEPQDDDDDWEGRD
jgi:uncharacterized membrane protein YqiK